MTTIDAELIVAQVQTCIKAHMREIADHLKVYPWTDLAGLGMDSLDRTELAITLEDKFQIENLTDHCMEWVIAADVAASVAREMEKKL